MRWISKSYTTLTGIVWVKEGWFFDNPEEDYTEKLYCRKCTETPRINECLKLVLLFYRDNSLKKPEFRKYFNLHCPHCKSKLGTIDEGDSMDAPLLVYTSIDDHGTLLNPPQS